MMRRGCGCLVLGALVCLVLAVAIPALRLHILTGLGHYLVQNEPPEKVDAVVALAGDDYGYRVLTAGRLVREGWAPYALISGTPYLLSNQAEDCIEFAVAHGFPRSYFRPFERDSVATRDESTAIGRKLKAEGVHKILLVTSNYHTRRAGRIMKQVAPFLEIRTVAAPDRYYSPDSWWKTRGGQRTFALEWSKTISAWVGY